MADCSTHVDLQHWSCVTETEWTLSSRVVSSEISSTKFPEIYSNLSGNLLIAYVNQLFASPALQSDAVKETRSWQTTPRIFMLCFSTAIRNISEFKWNLLDVITTRLLLIFPEISGNIKFLENLQPYYLMFTQFRWHSFSVVGPRVWNSLPSYWNRTLIIHLITENISVWEFADHGTLRLSVCLYFWNILTYLLNSFIPTFFRLAKMSLPKHSGPCWSNPLSLTYWHSGTLVPTIYNYLTFGHSGSGLDQYGPEHL